MKKRGGGGGERDAEEKRVCLSDIFSLRRKVANVILYHISLRSCTSSSASSFRSFLFLRVILFDIFHIHERILSLIYLCTRVYFLRASPLTGKCNFACSMHRDRGVPVLSRPLRSSVSLLLSPWFCRNSSSSARRWREQRAVCTPSCRASLPLPEAAQPLGQHGRASQVISNGAAAVTGKHHHVLGPVRRCRRTPGVQGRPAGRAEAAGAKVLVAGRRLAAT